jgi:uncharacterized membrane protein
VADALGILGMVVFIGGVIALAAAVTYVVVKLSSARDSGSRPQQPGEAVR